MLETAMKNASGADAPPGGESHEILKFLRDPSSYPEGCREVEMRETHISWVFLTERFAYKIKKPVRFDFLDFSTLPLRRQACREELRLNRRLAPEVYLSVTPIRRNAQGQLRLGGNQGAIVEWAVAMKRLPDDQRLDVLLAEPGGASMTAIRLLGEQLARFYAEQAPVLMRSSEYLERLANHIDHNKQDLQRLAAPETRDQIARIHNRQQRFVSVFRGALGDRVCDGCIVDGHGDLRPDHVYLGRTPVIIDCVEFNAEYRCNDIVDDLAFFAMECDRLHAPEVGRVVLEQYRRASRDSAPDRLIDFYKAYRACVRAKVAALQDEQQETTGFPKLRITTPICNWPSVIPSRWARRWSSWSAA